MAGTGVGKFSSTAGSNTANMTVNFAENMAPSNVNNAARELMGHMRDMYEQLGDGYFEFGDGDGTYTVARGDADTITITSASDISSVYFAGRKIRITDGGANVVEGTIASSSHSSTTQTVNLTGISLASGTPTKVELGIDTAAFGGRVILDDDGDTYIEAPTDDTIDIYVAGAKDFVITANTFTAESGSTIAAQALTATTGAFTDNVTITTADNTDTLELISTDADANVGPNLRLYRNSSSPADGDLTGDIRFESKNDAGQDVIAAQIKTNIGDVRDGLEYGEINFHAMVNGTLTEFIALSSNITPAIVFNEQSADIDFRVESNGNANMLFVDGGGDRVYIGRNTTDGVANVKLQVESLDSTSGISVHRASADTGGPALYLSSSRGASLGDDTVVQDGDDLGSIAWFGADGTDRNSPAASISGQVDGTPGSNDMPGRIVFKTTTDGGVTQTERMRILSDGKVLVGATSGDYRFEAYNAVGAQVAKIYNGNNPSSAAPHGLQLGFNFTPDNGTSTFLVCDDTLAGTTVNRLVIYSDGDVFNHDGTYGTISDTRLKDNIIDANSQWNDIKAIKVRNFERKDDIAEYGAGNKVQLGVIAQELESVSSKLIKEVAPTAVDIKVSSEFGTLYTADDAETKDGEDAVLFTAEDQEVIDGKHSVGDIKIEATHSKKVGDIKSLTGEQVKGVKYSVLYMKAIKALQEAMTRIETLETKVTALEG